MSLFSSQLAREVIVFEAVQRLMGNDGSSECVRRLPAELVEYYCVLWLIKGAGDVLPVDQSVEY
jgi:hypothetical protein